MSDVPEMAATPAVRELPLEFRATGAEYFRIWIVNLLLTVVTLGIYSAWAKVRRLRYFYGSTSLDGSSFEYHGRPVAILKGRLIVVGLYVLYAIITSMWPLAQVLGLPLALFGIPWIIVRSRLFQMRMTSWRGLRFNFHGRYGGAMAAYVGWLLLGILTFGLMWPYALWKQVHYLVANTAYGSQRFDLTTKAGTFYRFCLLSLLLLFGVGFFALVLMMVLGGFSSILANPERAEIERVANTAGLVLLPVMVLVFMVVGAFYRANFLNASIGGVVAGPHRLSSRLQTIPLLGILVTNLIGMVCTLGLFYPWAKVRLLRYQLANTSVLASGDLGQFVADAKSGPSALGEEAGDFFDIDFGI